VSVSQEITTQAATRPGWHASDASAVAKELGVEPERGDQRRSNLMNP
jgi:hypothetical protein